MKVYFEKFKSTIASNSGRWFSTLRDGFAAIDFRDRRVQLSGFLVAMLLVLTGGYYGYLFSRDGRENLATGHYKIAYLQYIGAADGGDPVSQNVIGNLYYLGLGVERDQLLAARWYLKAALKGYVPAQINLGQMFWNGQGVPTRVVKAFGWYHLARNAGNERAEGHISYMILANAIFPNQIEAAKHRYRNLKAVNSRYVALGEKAFLLN